MDIYKYWRAVLEQNAQEMGRFFHKGACVNFHNTNEHFTAEEFILANCHYPGRWDGEIERVTVCGELIITVVHVFSLDEAISCHVTSFIQVKDDRIESIDEYWGDDGPAPQWRRDMHIGTPIHP